jgi:hypothetical protein
MQITVASLPVKVILMKMARPLLGKTFIGATLIGVAPFVSALIENAECMHDISPVEWIPRAIARNSRSHALPSSPKNAKLLKVWKFVQRTTHGHTVVLVCDSAVRCNFNDQKVSWIASAPTWNVCIINTEKNLGSMRSLEYFKLRQDDQVESGTAKPSSTSKIQFLHQPAVKVTYDVTASDPIKEKTEMFYQTGSNRSSSFSKIEITFSNWFKISPQAQQVLNGIIRMSRGNGVILEEAHLYPGGRKELVLTTGSCTQCEVPVTEFAYPTGFKPSTMRDIMQEKQKAQEMSGVLQDLFIDEKKK